MAKLTKEQLERKLEDIEHRYRALEEEYIVVRQKIKDRSFTDRNIVELIERLRDNLNSRAKLAKEIQNAYKDSLDLQDRWSVIK